MGAHDKVKVSDYIARRVAEHGVRHVFMLTGGGAMHLNDSFGWRDDLELVFNHHEQACAIAAEGYARLSGGLAVVVVTTGPGGTNALTGVLGQWHDSVPVLYVSGQVRYDTTVASTGLPLRQLGDQEGPIVDIVAPITKYAAMVTEPASIGHHLDTAIRLALSGRPGPVWLDVPVDIQGAQVTESEIASWPPAEPALPRDDEGFDRDRVGRQAGQLVDKLAAAERPVLFAGSGIRTAGARDLFMTLAERLGMPVVTAWNAHDVFYDDHPLYVGKPSTAGDRAGNFAVQNSDLLVVVGCRLNIRQIGYAYKAFARHAFQVLVDIDPLELRKPTVSPDMAIHSDAGFFLGELLAAVERRGSPASGSHAGWLAWCRERRARYPVVLPEYRAQESPINPYVFVDVLSDHCRPGETIVVANGACCITGQQAFKIKPGQNLVANSGTASMGYDLPASIGACFATGKRVVCMAGEGSIQMNIQELQTIVHHRLPIKIFIFSNGGYSSIRQTQDNIFASHHVGEGPRSGVSFPDMVALARAYGIAGRRVDHLSALEQAIDATLAGDDPALCDVVLDPAQEFAPKVAAAKLPDGRIVSRPLEDMYPFLDRDELADNMLVPEWIPERGEP